MQIPEQLPIQRISDHRDSAGGESRRARLGVAAICLIAISLAGCVGAGLSSKPGVYEVIPGQISAANRSIHATWVRPLQDRHPGYLVVFSTGDNGWFGTSSALFRHLAEESYTLVGFSTPEVLEPIIRSGERVSTTQAARGLKELYVQANRHVGLPDTTPIVLVGFSRGASVVAFTAVHPELQGGIRGAVAIALTREADYLHVPESERGHGIQVDEYGRLQLYPALKLLGSARLAVIQSSHDDYVPAAESRHLLGSDTPTLRLYEVEAKDHGFRGARDKLMQDLDHALRWIEEATHESVSPESALREQ